MKKSMKMPKKNQMPSGTKAHFSIIMKGMSMSIEQKNENARAMTMFMTAHFFWMYSLRVTVRLYLERIFLGLNFMISLRCPQCPSQGFLQSS